ncbi:TPA: hypothetical protein NHK58_001400 [Pseudomonas aeruginosa]|nr:hypothetical protein [Pseudomonas aeruginosa]
MNELKIMEGEFLANTSTELNALFNRLIKFYPDLQNVFPLARVIANIGLYKPCRTFNGFDTKEDLAKSVNTIGPYDYLNYSNIKFTACDLSIEYDLLVFCFLLHLAITTKSLTVSFSVSNFMYFKDKSTKNSNRVEAEKLYKSLERHNTIDLSYSQKDIDISSRFISSFHRSRSNDMEFVVNLVPDFFSIYNTDGGYVIPYQLNKPASKVSLEDKLALFFDGSKFKTEALRVEFAGFCRGLGFALNGNKLDKKAKLNLTNALKSFQFKKVFNSYSFVEKKDTGGKKYIAEVVFYFSKEEVKAVEFQEEYDVKPDLKTDIGGFDNKSNVDVSTDFLD